MSEALKKKGIRSQGPFQIGFYANISQRPILKEIRFILNNKIRELINIRGTISRYLLSVEHQMR